MTAMLLAVVAVAVINLVFKGIGPALLGDRTFPAPVESVIAALPAVLLAGLLVVDLAGEKWQDADWTLLPGLGAGLVLRAVWQRSHLLCLAVAVLLTGALRVLVG